MNLQEWNEAQIQEAKDNAQSSINRFKYFVLTGNKYPSIKELEIFYLKDNAKSYAEHHER